MNKFILVFDLEEYNTKEEALNRINDLRQYNKFEYDKLRVFIADELNKDNVGLKRS